MRSIACIVCLCTAPVFADSPLPSDAVESIRVNQVIKSMHDAVNKVDVGAYMALIDPSDTFFLTEQRAWITDLLEHPVEDIEIAIAWNEPVIAQDDGSAIAPIEITWHIEGEELDRHFAYPARFEPVGAADGRWVFVGRAWEFSDTAIPGVRIYADQLHEDLAMLAGDRVAILRETIASNFQRNTSVKDAKEIVVKIYPDMASLQASIYLSYTDGLSGWNEPGESIKILGRTDFAQDKLDPLLGHEIGHSISFEFGPEITKAPWWALEGIAEVAAQLYRATWNEKTHSISELAKSDNLRDWELLTDFRGEANNHMMHVYLQGWSMVDYISRVYGLPSRNEWFTALANGASLNEASIETLEISFDDLDTNWENWLENWTLPPEYKARLEEEERKRALFLDQENTTESD